MRRSLLPTKRLWPIPHSLLLFVDPTSRHLVFPRPAEIPRKSRGLGVALIRLYPPYSLAEAAVIIIYLIRSPWYAWREGHRPKLQVISTNKWYQTRLLLNLRPFTSKIRMTAVALLSVRSKKQATLLATLRAQTPSQEVELTTIPPHTTRPGQATAADTDPTSGTLPRRRITNLEDGITLGTSEASRDETILATVDPDVLPHGHVLVDVVTFLSILAILAKLAFSTLSWPIRLTAWPLVVGWMALHAVLIIFHSGGEDGINTLESAPLIRELRMIEAELKGPTTVTGFFCVDFGHQHVLWDISDLSPQQELQAREAHLIVSWGALVSFFCHDFIAHCGGTSYVVCDNSLYRLGWGAGKDYSRSHRFGALSWFMGNRVGRIRLASTGRCLVY